MRALEDGDVRVEATVPESGRRRMCRSPRKDQSNHDNVGETLPGWRANRIVGVLEDVEDPVEKGERVSGLEDGEVPCPAQRAAVADEAGVEGD